MITIPLSLLACHFLSDFILQSDWMATNKSKNWLALLWHVSVYSLPFFFLIAWLTLDPNKAGFFWMATFISHFLTDAVTSRITSKLWFFRPNPIIPTLWEPSGGNRHYFFVMIGLDQLIHFWTLAWTYNLLIK